MRNDIVWAVGLFTAIVITAGLVNRYRPAQRVQVRRIVILYALHLLALGGYHAFHATGDTTWATRFLIGSELLKAFTLVNLGATLVFSVLLPAVGILLPMIASDLLVGIGYVASTLGVLTTNGMNPSNAVAASAVVSAVLALSLQATLGNILGGVALQLDGSIHEGDWVQLENGKQGKIRAIRWRHTVIETRDWSTMIVPNSQLLSNTITILGKRDGSPVPARYWVWFNVDFRYSPSRVVDVVTQALVGTSIQGVASDPPPNCVCMDFTNMRGGDSYAAYAVRYWLTDLAHDDGTNSRVRARIYTALRRAHIPLAVPSHHRLVQMDDDAHRRSHVERHQNDGIKALRAVSLFRSFTDDEVATLAEGLSHVIYTAGEICTKQGAVAHWLYVLSSGEVEIRVNVDPDGPEGPLSEKAVKVKKLTAPDVFGEMGLMTGAPRANDVVAVTDVDCYRLDRVTFEQVLLQRPEIAKELSEKLAERRAQLIAARDGLDAQQQKAAEARERDQILKGIRAFFNV
jgi:small-conductance mechanosensitive channel/CRP-like cAMP-binding protein